MDEKKLYCYFCGAKEKEVNYLIEGDDAYICDYCVEKANLVINENNSKKGTTTFELKNPKKNQSSFRFSYYWSRGSKKDRFCSCLQSF